MVVGVVATTCLLGTLPDNLCRREYPDMGLIDPILLALIFAVISLGAYLAVRDERP